MVERSYTARNRRFRAVHKARRAVRHSLGGIAESFSLSFCQLFLSLLPVSRPFGPQGRQVGRRSPSGRTAHPHHACLSAHPGNLPAHRPSAHGPTGRFFLRKKYPLRPFGPAFRPFFFEKNTPYGLILEIFQRFLALNCIFLSIF